jgi:hypothetical protein
MLSIKHSVNQAKNCRVRSNPESKDQNSRDSKSGRLEQKPNRVAEMGDQAAHPAKTDAASMPFVKTGTGIISH